MLGQLPGEGLAAREEKSPAHYTSLYGAAPVGQSRDSSLKHHSISIAHQCEVDKKAVAH